jgi:hypothetical protein
VHSAPELRVCAELSVKKRAQHLLGHSDADDPCADTEQIHVIVLDALVSGVRVMAQCGTDAGDFVCRDARSNAGSTHHNATLGCSTPYGFANETGDIWEVDWIEAMCAKVLDLMTLHAEETQSSTALVNI